MATTPMRIPNWLIHPQLWRFVGFFSSVVGLLCYALSSSFKHLFGEWNFLKIIVYAAVSLIITSIMLFAKKWQFSRSFLLKAHLGFLILMLTSLYSFFYDKAIKGKPDLLSLISCAAFAVMSLSLSRQIDLGFEMDLLNFFLGCLTIQLMKINLMLGFLAAIFCYTLIVRRSNSNSQLEIGSLNIEDHVTVEIDTVNGVERGADDSSGFQSDYSNHHQQTHSLRRRLNDGYNWRKYEEKIVKGSEKQRSYYKCPYTNCPAKKRVERSSDGQIIEVLYKGTHIHYKPNFTMKRNSSFETLHAIQPSKAVPAETPDQSFAFLGNEQMDLVDTPENSSISI